MTTPDSPVSRPALIASSLLAGLLPLAGNAIYEDPSATGDALLTQLSSPLPTAAYVGNSLELLGFVALVVLLGILVAAFARRAPVAAAVTGMAGAAMVAVKLASIAPDIAMRARPGAVDAGVAEILTMMNEASFVISGLLLSLALTAAGIGLVQSGLVSNWLAWWPAVVGPLGFVAAAAGFYDPDAYIFIPFLLLLVWMIVLAVATAVRKPTPIHSHESVAASSVS